MLTYEEEKLNIILILSKRVIDAEIHRIELEREPDDKEMTDSKRREWYNIHDQRIYELRDLSFSLKNEIDKLSRK